jgi:hypothetical protein
MIRRSAILTAILAALVCLSLTAADSAPNTSLFDLQTRSGGISQTGSGLISYQGYLLNAADSTAVTDTLEMTFSLFDTETKGNQLWQEVVTVAVQGGLFHVQLGAETAFPLGLFHGEPLFFQLEIEAQIVKPRQPVGWAAHSHWSQNAEQLDGHSLPDLDGRWLKKDSLNHLNAADGDPQKALAVDDQGRVGIGTQTPGSLLELLGNSAGMTITSLLDDPLLILRNALTDPQAWKVKKSLSNASLIVQNGEESVIVVKGPTPYVGIGTAEPETTLDVNGAIKAAVFIGDGSQLTNISGTVDNDWNVTNGDMHSIPTGGVGIGTSTPAGKLHVVSDEGNSAMICGLASAVHAQNGSTFNEAYLAGDDYGAYGRNEMHSTYGTLGGPEAGASGSDMITGNYGSLGSDSSGVRGYSAAGLAGYFNGISYFKGNVGIGTKAPLSELDVIGSIFTETKTEPRRLLVLVTSSIVGGGYIEIDGPNENPNLRLTNLDGHGNHGYVSVEDSAGNTQAAAYVDSAGDGVVEADVKNFRMKNPAQPGTEIWYACIEGPEAAAYVRGTGHLENGRAVVALPEHFRAVASPNGITVHLTPLSSASRGLAVVEKRSEELVVQELSDGTGTYDFDYLVMAVREGYEDYRVIRGTSEGLPAMAAAER